MKKFLIFIVGLITPFFISQFGQFEFVAVLISLIIWFILGLWIIRGIWRFLFQPPGEDSWRFQGTEGPALSPHITEYSGGVSIHSSAGLRASWLKEKIKNAKGRKKNKWEKELDSLSKKFDIDSEISANKRVERVKRKIRKQNYKESRDGKLVENIKCPHCGQKGKVHRKDNATIKETTKEAGIIGGVIGRKTVTEKTTTQMNCMNCGTSWNV